MQAILGRSHDAGLVFPMEGIAERVRIGRTG